MRRTAFRRLFNECPVTWLLRDEFSDTRAAGAVNGTMPTPGPGGARTTLDGDGDKLWTASDRLEIRSLATPVFGNPHLYFASSPLARSSNPLVVFRFLNTSGTHFVGFFSGNPTTSTNVSNAAYVQGAAMALYEKGTKANQAALASTTYVVFIIARSVGGAHYLISGGAFLYPTLVSVTVASADATLYAGCCMINTSGNKSIDFIRSFSPNWLPIPLCSDGFGSSFGTTDGAGHAETSGIGSGGGNVTWTQQVGTWANSAGKAAAATLSGGVAVATVPLSTKDVFAKVKVNRSAGAGGLTLRWTDSSNHLYAEHDGTNAYLKQVLSGSTTTLITAAATYSAGAEIVVDLNGTAGRLYYNNALVGTTSSVNSGLTATAHGLRSTDTSGIQLDDFVVYAKGTGGEYSLLNRYVNL